MVFFMNEPRYLLTYVCTIYLMKGIWNIFCRALLNLLRALQSLLGNIWLLLLWENNKRMSTTIESMYRK